MGLKTRVRMVRFDQAEELRELAVNSGKKVSQITREAVGQYLEELEGVAGMSKGRAKR